MSAMDAINALPDAEIPSILGPTHSILYPRLEANRAIIEGVPRKTFSYGSTDRHKLDIYYPKDTKGPVPILFWVYGGGFVMGDRISPVKQLSYANIGSFFALRGIATVIADYRLAPVAKYPAGGEDIKDAIAWVAANAATINEDAPSKLDVNHIFVMGHSAGAAHVITAVLGPSIFPVSLRPSMKGLILIAAPYHFRQIPPSSRGPSAMYYEGDEDEIRKVEPLGLFENASEDMLKSLPDLLALRSEREPAGMQAMHEDFLKFIKGKKEVTVEDDVMEKHNHISIAVSLGGGEGEEWGEKVVAWVKARA